MRARGHSFAFENSDEADESDSSPVASRVKPLSAAQLRASLTRRLTVDMLEQRMMHKDAPSATESLSEDPFELLPVRYPGAQGLPASLDSEDDTSSPNNSNNNNNNNNNNYSSKNKNDNDKHVDGKQKHENRTSFKQRRDSFSAPTSPTLVHNTRPKSMKVQELLGISQAGLRKECVRVAKDLSDRLQIESESYANYVSQTIGKKGNAGSNSMLLTSADIPLELILNDTVHRKMFRMLAESHMCSESVSLWERCNDFKKLVAKEAAVGPALAFNIYSNFLAPSAPKQVPLRDSLIDPIRRVAIDKSAAVTLDMFDQIQTEAYSTMQFSLYPAYLSYLNASRGGGGRVAAPKGNSSPQPISSSAGSPTAAASQSSVPSLRDCLCKEEFYKSFYSFAVTLLAGENVDFWNRVVQFQNLSDPADVPAHAQQIFGHFLSPTSANELNVSSRVRKKIQFEIENNLANNSTFNDAQREIYRLLSLDVYPKFCQTIAEGTIKLNK